MPFLTLLLIGISLVTWSLVTRPVLQCQIFMYFNKKQKQSFVYSRLLMYIDHDLDLNIMSKENLKSIKFT